MKTWNFFSRYVLRVGGIVTASLFSQGLCASSCAILNTANDSGSTQALYDISGTASGVSLSRISHLSTLAPQLDSLNLSVNVCSNGGTWFRNCPQEPWIAVNPTNPKNMIAGMIQDRLTWDEALGISVYFTFDGGVTWSEASITDTLSQNPTIPGSSASYQCDADPNIQFDSNGVAYMLAIPFNAAASSGYPSTYYPEALVLRKSYDGGQTWTKPTYIVEDGGTNFLDRQTLWPDRNPLNDPARQNTVYALWTDDLGIVGTPPNQCQLKFARSRDSGNTWDRFAGGNLYNIVFSVDQNANDIAHDFFFLWGGELTVLNDGTLVVTICNQQFFQGTDFTVNIPTQFLVFRSVDGGNNWNHVFTRNYTQAYSIAPDGNPIANYENGINIAYDKTCNILYAVTIDSQFATIPGHAGATITMSTDGGLTWSNPHPISNNGLVNCTQPYQPSWPTVAVAKDGYVGIMYGDFRNPDNISPSQMGLPTDWWFAVWKPGLTSFAGEIRITPRSFDTMLASLRPVDTYGIPNPAYMLGDYMRLQSLCNQSQDPNCNGGTDGFVGVVAVTNSGVTPPNFSKVSEKGGGALRMDAARRQDILFANINYKAALNLPKSNPNCGFTPAPFVCISKQTKGKK